jgi:hypothetical protein
MLDKFRIFSGTRYVFLQERNQNRVICQVKDVQHNGQQSCKQFFIVLNTLPRHVSASKCHLQGVTLFFHKLLQDFTLRFGRVWAIVHWVWAIVHWVRAIVHWVWAIVHRVWAVVHRVWAIVHWVWAIVHWVWAIVH